MVGVELEDVFVAGDEGTIVFAVFVGGDELGPEWAVVREWPLVLRRPWQLARWHTPEAASEPV